MTCANPTCTTEVPASRQKYCSHRCNLAANRRARMDMALDTERRRLQKPAKARAVQHMHDRQVVARARKRGVIQ